MLKPFRRVADHEERVAAKRKRRLRRIGMLPTLLTLGNLCLGIGAVYMCTREVYDLGAMVTPQDKLTWNSRFLEHLAPSYLSIGIWMLVGAIIFDALDGRVARKTGAESRFGEQMDSLADMVSWGVAPAMLMMTMVNREIIQWRGYEPFGYDRFGQLSVLIGLIFASCAALRLARFNVETSLADASHEGFRGLPSPGAGGLVIAMVFLHDHIDQADGWRALANAITHVLPFCTLAVALLMVSNVPYRHAGSFLLKRRPFSHLIPILVLVPFVLLYIKESLVIAAWMFVLSGLVNWVRQKVNGEHAGDNEHPSSDESSESQTSSPSPPSKKTI